MVATQAMVATRHPRREVRVASFGCAPHPRRDRNSRISSSGGGERGPPRAPWRLSQQRSSPPQRRASSQSLPRSQPSSQEQQSFSFQIRPCLKRANQASPSRQAHRLCRSHGGDTTLGAARDCDHAAATARGNHRRCGVPATAAARRLPALAQLPRTSKLGERWQRRRHDQEQQAAVFGGIRACSRIHP